MKYITQSARRIQMYPFKTDRLTCFMGGRTPLSLPRAVGMDRTVFSIHNRGVRELVVWVGNLPHMPGNGAASTDTLWDTPTTGWLDAPNQPAFPEQMNEVKTGYHQGVNWLQDSPHGLDILTTGDGHNGYTGLHVDIHGDRIWSTACISYATSVIRSYGIKIPVDSLYECPDLANSQVYVVGMTDGDIDFTVMC